MLSLELEFVYKEVDEGPYFNLKKYEPGTRMLIETIAGYIFDGIYSATERYGPNGCIRFHSLRAFLADHRTVKECFSTFCAKEIKSLRFFLPEVIPNGCIVSPYYKRLTFPEFEKCCDLCLDYQYITVVDKPFYDALKILRYADIIAVDLLGADIGKLRHANISLIMFCTKTQIYIFDLIITPKTFFDCGLKEILEDENILKVIYDSRVLCDVFYNRLWKVNLENSYDLLIADYTLLERNNRVKDFKNFRTVNELVEEYLDIPASIFMDIDYVKTRSVIYDRPIRNELKELAALKVVFYIPLWKEINAEINIEFSKLMQEKVDDRFKDMEVLHRQPSDLFFNEIVKDKTLFENKDGDLIKFDTRFKHLHEKIDKFKHNIRKERRRDSNN